MNLYIGSTVISVSDIERAATFWAAVLGYEVKELSSDWAMLVSLRQPWSGVSLQQSDQPKPGLNRLHFDLYTSDQAGEVARLEGLGARQIVPWPYPPDPDFVVLADPDGNEFCVVQTDKVQGV